MKRIWVKRDNIYYKPFYKQKSKIFLLLLFTISIIFFSYQIFYMNQLPNTNDNTNMNTNDRKTIIRGIRIRDADIYLSKSNENFKCRDSDKEIPFSYINDDYCDCPEDGSDEPGTNACANGIFYCKFQKRQSHGKERSIVSSRVNDGICDCCDGSDEWKVSNDEINQKCRYKCV